MTTIRFPKPGDFLNANDRQHWRPRAALTAVWKEAAYIAACQLGDPTERAHGPSEVRFYFPVRDGRKRDGGNWYPTVKACVDGLVEAGVWPDDNTDWVELRDSRFTRMTTDVVIEIRDLTADVPEPVWPDGTERELGLAQIRKLKAERDAALKGDAS